MLLLGLARPEGMGLVCRGRRVKGVGEGVDVVLLLHDERRRKVRVIRRRRERLGTGPSGGTGSGERANHWRSKCAASLSSKDFQPDVVTIVEMALGFCI